MGTQPPPKKEAELPNFRPVYCGQTAGWIKMALGMEVGRAPVHIVLDGDSSPPQKGGRAPPQFLAHLYCGQTAGCIKMPLYWYGGRPQPRRLCVRWGPSPYPQKKIKGTPTPTQFWPMSIVAKWLDG